MTLESSVHLRHTDNIKQGYKYGLVNSKFIKQTTHQLSNFCGHSFKYLVTKTDKSPTDT